MARAGQFGKDFDSFTLNFADASEEAVRVTAAKTPSEFQDPVGRDCGLYYTGDAELSPFEKDSFSHFTAQDSKLSVVFMFVEYI